MKSLQMPRHLRRASVGWLAKEYKWLHENSHHDAKYVGNLDTSFLTHAPITTSQLKAAWMKAAGILESMQADGLKLEHVQIERLIRGQGEVFIGLSTKNPLIAKKYGFKRFKAIL